MIWLYDKFNDFQAACAYFYGLPLRNWKKFKDFQGLVGTLFSNSHMKWQSITMDGSGGRNIQNITTASHFHELVLIPIQI